MKSKDKEIDVLKTIIENKERDIQKLIDNIQMNIFGLEDTYDGFPNILQSRREVYAYYRGQYDTYKEIMEKLEKII